MYLLENHVDFIEEDRDKDKHKKSSLSGARAIETFLGRKRFHIILGGKDCHKAMEILVIQNVFARRYANYLLNGIHLCENLEELHEYPKGGLRKHRLEP